MDDKEISALKEELRQLYAESEQHQARIKDLYNRLQGLGARYPTRHVINNPLNAQWSIENFIGLKLIHLVGIVVLVIGLSIGVKYAVDKNLISENLRIILAYAAGLTLFGLSRRLKQRYNFFSAILFAGSMASLYFTTYAAFVYYSMFPFVVAFAIMVALTVFTVLQAIVYNRQEIGILGLVGAYGIPFLISVNNERPDLFFLYISLINTAVAYLVYQKEWKLTGRIAQITTWLLLIAWSATGFKSSMQWTAIGFTIYFFLLFEFLVLSRLIVYRKALSVADSYQLVLNNIALYIAALFLFGSMMENAHLAVITFFIVVITAVQAAVLHFVFREDFSKRIMTAFAYMLLILFIAFEWSGLTVTMVWLLLAASVLASGFKLHSVPIRMAAITLMGITLGKLLLLDTITFSPVQKIISYIVLGVLLLVVSFFYQRRSRGDKEVREQ